MKNCSRINIKDLRDKAEKFGLYVHRECGGYRLVKMNYPDTKDVWVS